MTKLEEKLIQLGYKRCNVNYYRKERIALMIYEDENKTIKIKAHIKIKEQIIKNRNDIQKLHDSIECYDNQLKIMQKDLEVLKEYDNRRS